VSLTPVHDHRWDLCPAGARALQKRLASQAELRERLGPIALVAGLDVGFEVGGGVTRAAVAVLRAGDLQPAECRLARRPTAFPYVPGLLSFREIPAALDALAALRCVPDLLICDGQASPPGASALPVISAGCSTCPRSALPSRACWATSPPCRRNAARGRR
jgi:deoxyribonuclease V